MVGILYESDHLVTLLDFVRVGPSSNFGSSSSKSFGELSDQVSKVDHLVTLLDFFAKSEKLTI